MAEKFDSEKPDLSKRNFLKAVSIAAVGAMIPETGEAKERQPETAAEEIRELLKKAGNNNEKADKLFEEETHPLLSRLIKEVQDKPDSAIDEFVSHYKSVVEELSPFTKSTLQVYAAIRYNQIFYGLTKDKVKDKI